MRSSRKRPHGAIRRSQVLTTYGPGAMVDLPTGHWPMWSKPAELAQAIHDAARAS